MGKLAANDRLVLLGRPEDIPRYDTLFERPRAIDMRARDEFLGVFHLAAEAPTAEVLAAYGATVPASVQGETLAETLRRHLPQPVEGDRVRVGGMELTVRRLTGGRISEVGLRLPKADESH